MQGTFKIHSEIAKEVATAAPYKDWVNSNHRLEDLVPTNQYLQETQMELSQVLRLQAANGKSTPSVTSLILLFQLFFDHLAVSSSCTLHTVAGTVRGNGGGT